MKRAMNKYILLAVAGVFATGCIVVQPQQAAAPAPAPVVPDAQGPVIQAPGVEVIEVEPPPPDRVYIYDPGYPPGVYVYNNYYWYHGYRYPHDVFVDRYVAENIRERRFIDAEENRQNGQLIEARDRNDFAVNHGVAHPNVVRKPPPQAPKKKDEKQP